MQVHDLESGRVITLDESEQFAFIPPGDATPDTSWYATRAETVSVFEASGSEPAYFTVAGEQIHAPANVVGDDRFWELDMQFTDSGPLPPHVRRNVEDIVPVRDLRNEASREQQTAERRAKFEMLTPDAQNNVVEQIQVDETIRRTNMPPTPKERREGNEYIPTGHPRGGQEAPLGAIQSGKTWGQRLADRNKRQAVLPDALNPGRPVPMAGRTPLVTPPVEPQVDSGRILNGPSKVLDLSPGPEQPPFNSIPTGRPIYDRGGR